MTVGSHRVLPLLLAVAACSTSHGTATPGADAGATPRHDASNKTAIDASRRDVVVRDVSTSTRHEGGSDASHASLPPADAGACTSPDFAGAPLGVHCNTLVDTSGRTVLMHGMNARVAGVFDVTFTDGRPPVETIPPFVLADATRIRALGFNALRLPVSWSGIEPEEDGGIQSAYLDSVAAVTAMCKAAGLFVLIDFHQDSYSKEIGEDGAPLWAIVPPPTMLLGGPLTGDRFLSAQVQAAYSTFFGSPDGGAVLRTRFTEMAASVAAHFASDPAVVGFELYNEPWATPAQILALHQQMVPALRAAAPTKLLFFEPSSARDELDEAAPGDGSIGAGSVYAPHVYTLAFTNADEVGVTEQTYAASNVNALAEANSWNAPLVITEYGYPPSSPNFASWATWQGDLEDQVKASSFFWVWKEESQSNWGFYDFTDAGVATERPVVVKAMTRTRLEAVAGALVSESYDPSTLTMTVTFNGSSQVSAPNIVSVGAGASVPAAQWTATCDGSSVATSGIDPLSIPCAGPGVHTLVISAAGPDAG